MKTNAVIVLVIVVLIIGGLIWFYGTGAPSATTPVGTATTSPGTFYIPELGLSMPLTDDIKDLTYAAAQAAGEGSIVSFSSASLADTGGAYCTTANAPLGTIHIASSSTTTIGAQGVVLASQNGKSLFYEHPQATCSSDAEVQQLAVNQIAALQVALRQAQF